MWYAVIKDGQIMRRYNLDAEGAESLRQSVVDGVLVVAQPAFIPMAASAVEELVLNLRNTLSSQGLDSVLFVDTGEAGAHLCLMDAGTEKLFVLDKVIREHLSRMTREIGLAELLHHFAPGMTN